MCEIPVRVSRIQKFCTHDGPGVRTTVFFKGCPLRCAWCHNPETRSAKPGVLFTERLCVLCGACVNACENKVHSMGEKHFFHPERCSGLGKCAQICPTGALEADSTLMHTDEILREVLRDRAFYGEVGGLTVSGGEPMLQAEGCIVLLEKARRAGITTAVETCGYFDCAYLAALARAGDTFLWDFKDSDPERHKRYTGVSNEKILENLRLLDEYPVDIRLRCIMVEGVNMTKAHAEAISKLFLSLKHCTSVELLAYHAYGASKAAQAGIRQEPHREWIPTPERMNAFSRLLESMGTKLYRR